MEQSSKGQDYSMGGFIPAWVLLMLVGIAIEFAGRFFGYEGNPTQIYHTWIPQGTASLAGIIAVIGYFVFSGGKPKQSTLRRRNGVLLITTGALMLASSFIFKLIMPLLFG